MAFLLSYQWQIFIALEILSIISLLLFGLFRYFFGRSRLSFFFIIGFIVLLALEALLGYWVYQVTGEISTFLIIITIFVLYACTFGIYDFLKLDRWMRRKIGEWRGVELLTEKDYRILERSKDPKHIAKKYRLSAMIHLIIFVVVQAIFWLYGTDSLSEALGYLIDLSWIELGTYEHSPYPNETIYIIGMIWSIVFAIDFIYSWSYTIFPAKESKR